jgi:hypothetical protein
MVLSTCFDREQWRSNVDRENGYDVVGVRTDLSKSIQLSEHQSSYRSSNYSV